MVVVILVLAGSFDWLSGNPLHGIMLLAVAAILAWDVFLRHPGQPRDLPRPRLPPAPAIPAETARAGAWLLGAGALAFAVLVGGFARYSWPASVSVVIPGSVALVLAWRGPSRPRPTPPRIHPLGGTAWISVFVGLGLWELTQLLLQPSLTTDSYSHPTISVLTDPILATHPGRSIGLFLWLGLGWFVMGR